MTKTEPKTVTGPTTDVRTEPKTVTDKNVFIDPKTNVGYTFPKTITTAELSVIVSDVTGTDYNGRKLRSVLRTIIVTDERTSYRFDYPSDTVRRIVNRFVEIETERKTKRRITAENRKRSAVKTSSVIVIDDTGTVSTVNENDRKNTAE